MAEAQIFSAGKRTHAVWEFFEMNAETKRNICKVVDCGQTFSHSFTTTLVSHLERKHPEIAAQVLKNQAAKNPSKSKQQKKPKYNSQHPTQVQFNSDCALWVSNNSTIPNSVVEQEEFQTMILHLNSSLNVPTRATLNMTMNELRFEAEKKIKVILSKVDRLSISADIWTKKGQTSSFLGVLVTFYDKDTKSKRILLLDVKWIESVTHRATDILREMDSVLTKFDIDRKKIWFSVTDSGSNMVCAFKNLSSYFLDFEKELDEADILDDNEETEFRHDSLELPYNHYACFIHSLLLCLKPFYLVYSFKQVVSKAKNISKVFSHSQILTGKLRDTAGVKLVQFSKARWNIVYLFVIRFLKVRSSLNDILRSNGNNDLLLSEEDWEVMESIAQFLKPFNTFTNMTATDTITYFSEATLILKELEEHLNLYSQSNIFGLDTVAQLIQDEIRKRFNRYARVNSADVLNIQLSLKTLPLYLAATLLDPRHRHTLDEREQFIAKQCINQLKNLSNQNQIIIPETLVDPPSESKKYPNVSKKYVRVAHDRVENPNEFDEELNGYLSSTSFEWSSQCSPLDYWNKKKCLYPTLSTLAMDIISLPLNTAPLERTFSIGGISTAGLRNNLDRSNLSREIFMARNKNLLE